MTPLLLSLEAAAELVSVSPDFLRRSDAPRYALRGRGRNERQVIRYDRDELVAWAKSHRVGDERRTA